MRLGIQSLQMLNARERSMADQIDDAVVVLGEADRLGFDWVSASQHWLSGPTVWPQPFPLIARLAAELPRIRFMTQMLVLPLHNAVDAAEQVATLDHVTRGRLTLGCAIGYRELELRAAGIGRRDRVSRMEEAIALMKLIWSGEEVRFAGRWWSVDGGQSAFPPYQRPHPPLVLAAQSEAAARRAARLADGVFFGPQVALDDLRPLIAVYRDTLTEAARGPGSIGAGRALMLGRDREDALRQARAYAERTMRMYSGWDMQERGMVRLQLERIDDWAIVGSPADCVEGVLAAHEAGLDGITLTAYNLPEGIESRVEYVQRLGEEVVAPVKRALAGTRREELADA